jgi:hypothetical protein
VGSGRIFVILAAAEAAHLDFASQVLVPAVAHSDSRANTLTCSLYPSEKGAETSIILYNTSLLSTTIMASDPELIKTVSNDYKAYQPLTRASQEIRVLMIDPGAQDTPITCDLMIVSLETIRQEFPVFECLSYCWGKLDETSEIQLSHYERGNVIQREVIRPSQDHRFTYNGRRLSQQIFNITTNLESALRSIRHELESRLIWVDALCINQHDVLERASQVELMSEIYELASCVVIWLGEADAASDMALLAARSLSSKFRADLEFSQPYIVTPKGILLEMHGYYYL